MAFARCSLVKVSLMLLLALFTFLMFKVSIIQVSILIKVFMGLIVSKKPHATLYASSSIVMLQVDA